MRFLLVALAGALTLSTPQANAQTFKSSAGELAVREAWLKR